MVRINLLPWRQAERERKNREFLTIVVGVLLLSLLAAFTVWSYFNNTLDSQKQANEKIKSENIKLDTALKEIDSLEKQRNDMLAQMKVIQDLQGRRPIPVRVWDDIARLIPAQLYLTNMKREGDKITFTGRADNPNVVSEFIRNLDSSQWLEGSEVRSINQPKAIAYQPIIDATATNPNTPAAHPEDNYVIFVVTTNIATTVAADSTTAATELSATAATPQPAVTTGLTPTSAPQTTAAKSAAAVTPTSAPPAQPVVSASRTTSATTTTTSTTAISNEALKPVTSPATANTVTGGITTPTASATIITANKESK